MVPGITHICVKNYMEQCLKNIRNERTDIYNIMCCIDEHKKQQPSYVYYVISGGGKKIQPNLTTEALDSLGAAFDFIYFWYNDLVKTIKLDQICIVNLCKSFLKDNPSSTS